MKKLLLSLLCLPYLIVISPAHAGECLIQRLYKNEKNIMRHFSFQPLGAEAASNSARCSEVCKREATILPPGDAASLKSKKDAINAEIKCSFKHDGGSSKAVDIGNFTAPVERLQSGKRESDYSGRNRTPAAAPAARTYTSKTPSYQVPLIQTPASGGTDEKAGVNQRNRQNYEKAQSGADNKQQPDVAVANNPLLNPDTYRYQKPEPYKPYQDPYARSSARTLTPREPAYR